MFQMMRRRAGRAAFWPALSAVGLLSLAMATTADGGDAQYGAEPIRVAALFGESDEEIAARQLHEDNQDAEIRQANQRIHDLEESLRQATGRNEELSHRIDELNARIDRQQKDFEYRLCSLAQQQLAAGAVEGDQPLNCGGSAAPSSTYATPSYGPSPGGTYRGQSRSPDQDQGADNAGSAPRPLARGPGVLGTLPKDDVGNLPPPPPAQTADTKHQYDAAMNLLAGAQYDEARSAFRSFADAYPDDPLTPQAVYWTGDIAYVQKDYAGAAHAFAEQIKKYPTSSRAPASMVKLGQSLIAMGQKKEGCVTLAAVPAKYPSAQKGILAQAAAARKAAACKER